MKVELSVKVRKTIWWYPLVWTFKALRWILNYLQDKNVITMSFPEKGGKMQIKGSDLIKDIIVQ